MACATEFVLTNYAPPYMDCATEFVLKKAALSGSFQTVEKPQFCIRQNWGFERIVAKI